MRSITITNTKQNNAGRYRQLASVMIKHRLGHFAKTIGIEQYVPFYWALPNLPKRNDPYSQAEHVRMALEEMGTTFVKIGQILSTRADLLQPEYLEQLSKLQSSLKPLPVEVIQKAISDELRKPWDTVFATFDPNPVGVASIGQAHAATLEDGTEVVVKVRKPGVIEQVEQDLDILFNLAAAADKEWEGARHYDLVGIAQELSDTLRAELDYIREGHNADHFAVLFKDDPTVHIPKVFWQFTTSRVITLERIRGVHITDVETLSKEGYDRKLLAIRSVNVWLKMIFEDGAFHADPHPGNLFVEKNGHLGIIDFGMVGTVDDEIREHLASAVQGIVDKDVDTLAESIMELGAVGRDGTRERLRRDLKHFINLYPSVSVEQLKVNIKLNELFSAVHRNHLQLPSNTFLLLKTIAMVEGMGEKLDPDFEIMPVVEPHVRHLLKKRYAPSLLAERLPEAAADLASLGMELPRRLIRLVKSAERGETKIQTEVTGLDPHMRKLEQLINRMVLGIIAAAFINGLAVLVSVYHPVSSGFWLGAMMVIGFGAATFLGAGLVWGIVKSGRK